MPRGAQVIYPKDLGAILVASRHRAGPARARGRGAGPGALSMTVLRAGASVVGYELRPDFAERATANVVAALGPTVAYRIEIRDVTEGIDETGLDRILLDMPEPHKVVPAAGTAAAPGRNPAGPTCPPSTRPRCCVRRSTPRTAPFGLARPRRSCGAPGTSRHVRCARTTAWWGIPGPSPRPAEWHAENGRRPAPASVALDEDALPGALLGGLHHCVLELTGDGGHPRGPTGLVLDCRRLPSRRRDHRRGG